MATSHAEPATAGVVQLVQLPCTLCGKHAATLAVPDAPPKMLKRVRLLIDAADSILGGLGDFEIPKLPKDKHPLVGWPPELIAGFLGVVHPDCAATAISGAANG